MSFITEHTDIFLLLLFPVTVGIIGRIIRAVYEHNQIRARRRQFPPRHSFHGSRVRLNRHITQIETIRTPQPRNHSIQVPHCYTVQVPPSFDWEDTVDLTPFPSPLIPPEPAAHICHQCGHKNEIDSLFCTQCGTEL